MRLQRFTKTPDEIKRYGVDYTKWLDSGELVQSVTVTVNGPDTTLVANNAQVSSDNLKIIFYVSGGTIGNTYNVYVEITTNAQQLREDTIPFVVVSP